MMKELDLVAYIKEQLGSKLTVQAVITSLEAEGYNQEQIDAAFRLALHPASSINGASTTGSTEPKKTLFNFSHFDLTKAFLFLGSILVLVALIIVIYSQWATVTPLVRISFLALPMLALYLTAWFLSKKPDYLDAFRICLATASLMLPFTVGTFLYQTGILPTIGELLFFCSAASALIFYIVFEYILKQTYFSVLTVTAFGVALVSLLTDLSLDILPILWIMFSASALVAIWGIFLASRQRSDCGIYITVGTIATLVLLPVSTLTTLDQNAGISYQSALIIVAGFGLLNLAVASFYNVCRSLWQPETFYRLKRFLEETAVLVILTPLLILGFQEDFYTFVALVFSLGFVLLRTQVAISSLATYGALGTVISVIAISSKYFADSIGWPIIVFLAGFVAIGLGLLIRKMTVFNRFNTQATLRLGLGQDPAFESHSRTFGWAKTLGVLILIFLLLQFVMASLSGLHDQSNYSSPKSAPTEPYQERVPASSSSVEEAVGD
ncbi:MAG: DUF2157 domain-containing protein [bacterium]|nr:DUF2157 domain-containing protein [bacterium]